MKLTSLYATLFATGCIFLAVSCANRAQGPTGGPKDITPPQIIRSNPANNSLNFNKNQVIIEFDENISVEKAQDNIVISPPQMKAPDIKSYGKKLTVQFNEELKDTTTYAINFGSAIVDLNERNPLKNYLFSFSTGEQMDTLRVSGTVINAEDLNPVKGILVGIYVENTDSAFLSKPFMRIGRTDENGRFSIDNMKKGKYRIYALGDTNRDYFMQPGEGLAMQDSLISPYCSRELMKDTVWKDSTQVDSIRTYMGTRFQPDDILLRFFKENRQKQYYVKYERKEPFSFKLFFNAAATELPNIKPLNFDWEGKYIVQKNNTMDSLTYWLTDSTVWAHDTLKVAMSYLKTDSVYKLYKTNDTLNLIWRRPQATAKSKNNKTKQKIGFFKFSDNLSATFEVYQPIELRFEAPVNSVDVSKITLSHKVDSTYKSVAFKWKQADSTRTIYNIDYKWLPDENYELKIDSGAFESIYKKSSNEYVTEFKIRSLDEYSGMKIYLAPYQTKAILQVLNTRDEVLVSKRANTKGTLFEYLKPGDYYLRMFIDSNENGVWDTGDYKTHRQPEEVYYYNKKFTLKANWEFEETWNYIAQPLLKQKPAELVKASANKRKSDD